MKRFAAKLHFQTDTATIPEECWDMVESFRQIVESNYNYAHEKYGNDFNLGKVDSYQCVNIAKSALAKLHITVEVTDLTKPKVTHVDNTEKFNRMSTFQAMQEPMDSTEDHTSACDHVWTLIGPGPYKYDFYLCTKCKDQWFRRWDNY